MSGQPSRGLPIGPLLAIVGGGLGAASLLMPWFTFNTAAVNAAITNVYSTEFVKGQQMSGVPINGVQAQMHATVAQLTPTYAQHLLGYQTYSQASVAVQGAAAAIAILVGLLGLFGLLRRRGLILFACAIAMVGRQAYTLVVPPADKVMQSVGFENTHLLSPTGGFWLGMIAAVVLLASTFGITARAAKKYEMPAGKYGNDGPHVPTVGGNGSASSQPYASGAAYSSDYGAGQQAYVPGVGGAMNSAAPLYGSEPTSGGATYGAPPTNGAAHRNGPPPLT